ncbi:GNAT family N-acetyltransferase [Nonomuraea sp. MG754425]|uniref:GNAT family N-acetyltransferase n=1 Tax=Nonomuraea sp. MG754425 TaxID=2570319 RepID=UPI001F3A5B09|nr:GNAT family N-acetyltransferase [Nonomuraea sp. MG754425]MCF6474236.1 GNAT family N-acetyltransferase [Nonomuraea sp. MG754425]
MADLTSDRLLFVPLSVADAEEMVHVLSAHTLYTFTGGSPPTLTQLRDRYTRQAVGRSPDGSQDWHNWILREQPDGTAIGFVQATVMDEGRRAEVAWVIGAEWQGHGYASEAATTMIAWLRASGVVTVQAHIHHDHTASAAVARKAGLRLTGRIDDGEQLWLSDSDEPHPPTHTAAR